MSIHIRTKGGLKAVDLETVRDLQRREKLRPDMQCLTVDGGKTWLTIEGFTQAMSDPLIYEMAMQPAASGAPEPDPAAPKAVPHAPSSKPSRDPYEGMTRSEMRKLMWALFVEREREPVVLLPALAVGLVVYLLNMAWDTGRLGAVFLGGFAALGAAQLIVQIRANIIGDKEILNLRRALRNRRKEGEARLRLILWGGFVVTLALYVAFCLSANGKTALVLAVALLSSAVVTLLCAVAERLSSGLTAKPGYWVIPLALAPMIAAPLVHVLHDARTSKRRIAGMSMAARADFMLDSFATSNELEERDREFVEKGGSERIGYCSPAPATKSGAAPGRWIVMWDRKGMAEPATAGWLFLCGRAKGRWTADDRSHLTHGFAYLVDEGGLNEALAQPEHVALTIDPALLSRVLAERRNGSRRGASLFRPTPVHPAKLGMKFVVLPADELRRALIAQGVQDAEKPLIAAP